MLEGSAHGNHGIGDIHGTAIDLFACICVLVRIFQIFLASRFGWTCFVVAEALALVQISVELLGEVLIHHAAVPIV